MNRVALKMGELFCGAGGLALGAKLARVRKGKSSFRIEHGWATDYDKDACNTYRRNICPDRASSVMCKDIRKLDFASLERICSVDLLAFGFPCNDFSVVGEQRGIDGVYGPLYSYAVEALKHLRPNWFVAENVGGLRNSNEGEAFEKILRELSDCGYSVVPHLYKFEQYGVPQARHRIIIVGSRMDLNLCFCVPSPVKYSRCDVSCRTAIENPRIPENVPNQELTKHSRDVVERLKYIRPGENAFTAELPPRLQLNVSGVKISVIYKRLDPEKPAYTVTGSGGGGTHVYHWSENRALTNRERARLQTFPDSFVFSGSKESVRKQIGMAVPPKGSQVVFEAILKTVAGIRYASVDANLPSPSQRYGKDTAVFTQLRFLEREEKYATQP